MSLYVYCRFLYSPPQDYWEGVAGCRKFQKSEVRNGLFIKYKYKIGTKLVQVYAPSNEAEYREYREWFLSINTASGGDA